MRKHMDGQVDDLATVALFKTCTRRELEKIASLCTPLTVQPGFVLTTQGCPGQECFVIRSGVASVTVGGREIATVGAGDRVGEMALLDGGPRSATVTARTSMAVYVLTVSEFRAMIDSNPDVHRKVTAHLVERLRTSQGR
jgi:CRP/FNR family transcriptional regulator, cyclic AMP receptor protein